jgi:uncharacterized membrane protein
MIHFKTPFAELAQVTTMLYVICYMLYVVCLMSFDLLLLCHMPYAILYFYVIVF